MYAFAAAGVVLSATVLYARRAGWHFGRARGGAALSSEAKLGATWAGVYEVMLCKRAAGEDVYLTPQRPAPSGPRTLPLPPLLRSHVVYALTAFDPPGESRTLAANAAANGELWAGIRKLDPQPAAAWPTWGYNLDEGWRDSLAYPRDGGRADDARKAVVKLARKFGQGAIFEYAPSESLTDGLVRTTVPALSSEAVREVVNVWRVPEVPVEAAPALLERPWAGPAEAAGGWVRSVE